MLSADMFYFYFIFAFLSFSVSEDIHKQTKLQLTLKISMFNKIRFVIIDIDKKFKFLEFY